MQNSADKSLPVLIHKCLTEIWFIMYIASVACIQSSMEYIRKWQHLPHSTYELPTPIYLNPEVYRCTSINCRKQVPTHDYSYDIYFNIYQPTIHWNSWYENIFFFKGSNFVHAFYFDTVDPLLACFFHSHFFICAKIPTLVSGFNCCSPRS